jgi:peptidoglycan hydrolase-like protein with peptidoglycan-binding domain
VGGPYLTAPPSFQVSIVKKAQQNLKLLGFYGGSANGAPDAALTDALRAYQKAHRFKASGRLDKTTLQALDLLTLPPED